MAFLTVNLALLSLITAFALHSYGTPVNGYKSVKRQLATNEVKLNRLRKN